MYQHGYVILRLNDTARTAQADYYLAGSPATPFYSEMLTDTTQGLKQDKA